MFARSSNWSASKNTIYQNGSIRNCATRSIRPVILNCWRHVATNSTVASRFTTRGRQRTVNALQWTKTNGHRRVLWRQPTDPHCVCNRNKKSFHRRTDTSAFHSCEPTMLLPTKMTRVSRLYIFVIGLPLSERIDSYIFLEFLPIYSDQINAECGMHTLMDNM